MSSYFTVPSEAEAEFTERRSRFIGRAAPAGTEEQALAFIRTVRAANREAAHNVFAYVLREGSLRRCSDDGEPQGTAGVPVLDAILKCGAVDTAVVVTRYFGGILLGTGGLVRAYSHGASIALEAAGQVEMRLCRVSAVSCGYAQYGRVAPLIAAHGGSVDGTEYTDCVRIAFHLPEESFGPFSASLADATCGSCAAEPGTRKYFAFS